MRHGDRSTPWLYFLRYVPQYAHKLASSWLEEHMPLVTVKEAEAIYHGIIEGRITSPAGVQGKRLTQAQREGLFRILSKVRRERLSRSQSRKERMFRRDRKREAVFVCRDAELMRWVKQAGCLFAADEVGYLFELMHGTRSVTPEMMTGGIPEGVREEAARRFEQYRRNFRDGGFETVRESSAEAERIAQASRRKKAQEAHRRKEEERRRKAEWEEEWRRYLASRSTANAPDPFTTLGLSRNASQEEIRRAYRQKVREVHPDQGGSPEEFKKVQAAYESLRRVPA